MKFNLSIMQKRVCNKLRVNGIIYKLFVHNKYAFTQTKDRAIQSLWTNGNQDDPKYFKELVEQSEENGIEIDEVLGDTAYLTATNLEFAENKENFNCIFLYLMRMYKVSCKW